MSNKIRLSLVCSILLTLLACASATDYPVSELYVDVDNSATRLPPVVFVSGFLGSTLIDRESGEVVWGKFLGGQQAMFRDTVRRRLALPMTGANSLAGMRDAVEPVAILDNVQLELGHGEVSLNAYPGIIHGILIGAGSEHAEDEAPSAGDLRRWARSADGDEALTDPTRGIAYDWRRDITEATERLDAAVEKAYAEKLGQGYPPDRAAVDVVAHSQGTLLLRYYLRYGTQVLPADGSLPVLDWRGAKKIRRAILVGPPNGGSLDSLMLLAKGGKPHVMMPHTPAAVTASFTSLYQMIPHSGSFSVRDASDGTAIDIYDVATWEKLGWGLFQRGDDAARALANLMPGLDSAAAQRAAAQAYVALCLDRALQFHRALDIPATPPAGTTLHLFASNTLETEGVATVDTESGEFIDLQLVPGDGRVSRKSALGDRSPVESSVRPIKSPIAWTSVHFVPGEHFGMVRDSVFVNNLMYLLLQAPYPE